MIDAALPFIFVFLAVAALDFVWAYYTKAIHDHHAWRGAMWAAGIIVLGGASQIGYTNEPILLIPAALGAAVGTFAAVRLHAS